MIGGGGGEGGSDGENIENFLRFVSIRTHVFKQLAYILTFFFEKLSALIRYRVVVTFATAKSFLNCSKLFSEQRFGYEVCRS